jgi:hypothetical protein
MAEIHVLDDATIDKIAAGSGAASQCSQRVGGKRYGCGCNCNNS